MNAMNKLLFAVGLLGSVLSAEPVYEVWGAPSGGLMWLDVPETVAGTGPLAVVVDGEAVPAQEVVGGGVCVVRLPQALREKARTDHLKVSMARLAGEMPKAKIQSALVVSNVAFQLGFDAMRNGGWPHRLAWASGKTCEAIRWGDRVYTQKDGAWNMGARQAGEVLDFGSGPIFRQIRTKTTLARGGKASPGRVSETCDWIFLNDAPEWVGLRLSFQAVEPQTWEQVQAGILEFPFGVFDTCAIGGKKGAQTRALPRNGKPDRPVGWDWVGFVKDRDFAAVFAADNCAYTDPGRKVDYLHASYRVSYSQTWPGEPLVRTAFYRFGSAQDPVAALARTAAPIGHARGARRLDLAAQMDVAAPGETLSTVASGDLAVRVGVRGGTSAAIRSVRVADRLVAAGPQPLFSVQLEACATGKRFGLSSTEAWRSVETLADGHSWRFTAPASHPELDGLQVVVRACPVAGGLDWSWSGVTGSDAFAFAEATVGALEFQVTGPSFRALYPGSMGHVEENPCGAACAYHGNYPSMSCVMPWEAVWDERTGRGFYVGAHDPRGGAKYVVLKGVPARAGARVALTHRLSWDGTRPGAPSEMSGTIAWRPFAGDWYPAARIYRDWVREHAVWYPKMGPKGRVSTPDWFKDLGFIVRTWGWATNAVADVKTCQEWLGVPVMAHWYVWHRQPFDNDYPHYFPAKPGFEEGVRQIQAMGGYAVPYTNGHLWDLHDRGAEDWQFSSVGAAGACRRLDGSIVTERYRSVETNGQPVVFAAMCPASRTWHDKVGENCDKVVNGAGLNGYYMDQVGAFSTIDCRNPAHGHPCGGGSWWQDGYRKLLADARARCGDKQVFFATEGNAEHTFDQIDAFVCWHIEGGEDTVPAFEVCYSGAVTIYCRSYTGPKGVRQMRMKFANILADGHLFGWLPASYGAMAGASDYLRACVRFRHANAAWFAQGEMCRPPRLVDAVPVWDETWDIFGHQRPTRMPIVQTAARRILDYDYAPDGRRQWRTGRVRKAFVYFTNFSDSETATTRVKIDWNDIGIDPTTASFTRIDAEGRRAPFSRAELEASLAFAPGTCWGVEICP